MVKKFKSFDGVNGLLKVYQEYCEGKQLLMKVYGSHE
jgi:hypothetical protein